MECGGLVRVIRAFNLPKTDVTSKIDAYIVLKVNGQKVGKTATQQDNEDPQWVRCLGGLGGSLGENTRTLGCHMQDNLARQPLTNGWCLYIPTPFFTGCIPYTIADEEQIFLLFPGCFRRNDWFVNCHIVRDSMTIYIRQGVYNVILRIAVYCHAYHIITVL